MQHRCAWVAFKARYFHQNVCCKLSGVNVGKGEIWLSLIMCVVKGIAT